MSPNVISQQICPKFLDVLKCPHISKCEQVPKFLEFSKNNSQNTRKSKSLRIPEYFKNCLKILEFSKKVSPHSRTTLPKIPKLGASQRFVSNSRISSVYVPKVQFFSQQYQMSLNFRLCSNMSKKNPEFCQNISQNSRMFRTRH